MRLKPALLWWQWRRALPVTIIAMVMACGYALLAPGRLGWGLAWDHGVLTVLFVILHSVALVTMLGRPSAFLYARGFSRDAIWAHTMLAHAAAVLTVWLAVGLIVWTPLRSMWQDLVMKSPFYPGAAFVDRCYPLGPLLGYAAMLPPLHYAWIRMAQPMRGRLAGVGLAVWFAIGGVGAMLGAWESGWMGLPTVCVAALLLVWGWRLHRRLEVSS